MKVRGARRPACPNSEIDSVREIVELAAQHAFRNAANSSRVKK
jgi:hypothetical protein